MRHTSNFGLIIDNGVGLRLGISNEDRTRYNYAMNLDVSASIYLNLRISMIPTRYIVDAADAGRQFQVVIISMYQCIR